MLYNHFRYVLVFSLGNISAVRFYMKAGYSIDPYSPIGNEEEDDDDDDDDDDIVEEEEEEKVQDKAKVKVPEHPNSANRSTYAGTLNELTGKTAERSINDSHENAATHASDDECAPADYYILSFELKFEP